MIEIKEVSKVFGPHPPPALENITVSIPQGKMVGLAGPDGAGKTTLIRLIANLLLPTTGTISAPTDFGYMPQKFGLYEDLTVQQNLNLYADLRGVFGKEKKIAFKKLLDFTSLGPFTDRLAGKLSGGMKQKLGLACALIKTPKLLLLDEPTVGVDPISRRELWKMVSGLLDQGISIIWSTAYLDEAERCDTVILINDGKVLFQGPPQTLTERVKNRVYKISDISVKKRQVLTEVLDQPEVLDAIIQGNDIRILVKEPKIPNLNFNFSEALPRFEDGFIDILGGTKTGTSVLAEKRPEVKQAKEVVIEAEGLTKKFGDFIAANDITFKIPRGEIFGLLGPNGAGKSTTFKMMCGLLKPTSGKAFVNGYDLRLAPGQARSQIGYMAQKFSLYGDLSVLENLKFFSGIYNLNGQAKKDAIEEMIEIFRFQDYLNETSSSLPLGYKQRLALACSVMHNPPLLFLDEPTSGVDPITRREFWNHINGLVQKGVTVMVTTHFMDEAEYCDRIGLIYKSRLIRVGTPDTLKKEATSATLEEAFIKLIEEYDKTKSLNN